MIPSHCDCGVEWFRSAASAVLARVIIRVSVDRTLLFGPSMSRWCAAEAMTVAVRIRQSGWKVGAAREHRRLRG